MKKDIDIRKLNRLRERGDDVRGIYLTSQERWQTLHKKGKDQRSLITERAQPQYQDHVARLSIDELKKLPPDAQAALPVNPRDVEDLVDTLERAANARKKAESAGAESNAFNAFVNDLINFAGVQR